jgi:Protein of unknown function (DUF3187)
MNRHLTMTVVLFLSAFFFASPAVPFDGPFPVRNQFPLYRVINPPSLEKASLEDSFSADLSYASVYMVQSSSTWSIAADMEVAELDLRFRKSFNDSFELGIDVPFISFNSGFMDSFLNDYHRAFGFPDYGRSERPLNSFLYEVRRNGVLIIKGDTGTGIGDIRLTAKKTLLRSDSAAITLLADVELPTGDASRGFGNGSLDAGGALLVEKTIGEKVKVYGNVGILFPGKLRANETLTLDASPYAGLGVEAAVWSHLSLLGQVMIQKSPLPETGIGSLDRPSVLLSLGGRYAWEKNSLDFAFTEDPNTAGAPDVSFTFSFKRRF